MLKRILSKCEIFLQNSKRNSKEIDILANFASNSGLDNLEAIN